MNSAILVPLHGGGPIPFEHAQRLDALIKRAVMLAAQAGVDPTEAMMSFRQSENPKRIDSMIVAQGLQSRADAFQSNAGFHTRTPSGAT